MLDRSATETAFESSVAAVRTKREVIDVVGPEAADYLHGQLSQNVLDLTVGAAVTTLLLQPQGKIDARLRLTRMASERYWLDVEVGFGQHALERLQRFKLRVDAELSLRTTMSIALRGPAVATMIDSGELGPLGPDTAGGAVLDALWPGVIGVDLIGDDAAIPAGIEEGDRAALDALRIRLGVPAMGTELTDATIPAAAGIVDQAVDFTKGCYVGQELVARIDSRGNNTPFRLRGLRFESAEVGEDGAKASGAELRSGDEIVGTLTSAAPFRNGAVGLAYIKRGVELPAEAELVVADGEGPAVEVVELPLG